MSIESEMVVVIVSSEFPSHNVFVLTLSKIWLTSCIENWPIKAQLIAGNTSPQNLLAIQEIIAHITS